MDPTRDLILPHVRPRTVQILIEKDPDLYQFGTGVLLRIADSGLLVTAAHVADHYSDLFISVKGQDDDPNLVVSVHQPSQGILRGTHADGPIAQLSAYSELKTPMPKKGRLYDDFDIAVFHLTDEMCTWINEQSYEWLTTYNLSRAPAGPPLPSLHRYVIGYPGMHGSVDQAQRELVTTLFCWKTREFEDQSERHQKTYELTMHLDNTDESLLPDTRGMSGGGVWTTNPQGDIMLVGVQHSQNRSRGLIRATHVSVMIDMIRKGWPELCPPLNIVLPSRRALGNLSFEKTSYDDTRSTVGA